MITKTGELGIVNRTDYARVTIFPGRPLANRYALNVVDLCPVGAMTSRDFRFQQRVWLGCLRPSAFVPLCFIAVLVWMERRGAGFIQDRSGPNRANIFGFRAAGLVQNLADAVKLLTKEDVIPGHVRHKFYFVLAPVILFFVSVLSFAAVPFADILILDGKEYMMQTIPTDLGILWFLAIVGFAVYGIILAGWSSHNKYSMLGGLRSASQVISYEIPLALAIISMLIVYGTVNLTEIASTKANCSSDSSPCGALSSSPWRRSFSSSPPLPRPTELLLTWPKVRASWSAGFTPNTVP
jgi:hypothetical protein